MAMRAIPIFHKYVTLQPRLKGVANVEANLIAGK